MSAASTGRLLKKLLVGRLARLHADPEILPIGARPILLAVVELIAESPEPGVYRPDPELVDGVGSLVRMVAWQMKLLGNTAYDQIAVAIDDLTRLGFFLVYADGSMRLAIEQRPSRSTEAPVAATLTDTDIRERFKGMSMLGRPKAYEPPEEYKKRQIDKKTMVTAKVAQHPRQPGETERDWQLRVLVALGHVRDAPATPVARTVQPSLLMAQAGGRGADEPLIGVGHSSRLRSRVRIVEPEITRTVTQTIIRPEPDRVSSGLILSKAAAEEKIINSISYGTAAAKEEGAGAHAAEPEITRGVTRAEPAAGYLEPAKITQIVTRAEAGHGVAQTQGLALQVSNILEMRGQPRGTDPATLVSAWLQLGLSPERILAVAREHKDSHRGPEPIGTFDYLNEGMHRAAGLAAPLKASVAPRSKCNLPERLKQPWMNAQDLWALETALAFAHDGKTELLSAHLKRMARTYPRLLPILAKERPELAVAVGYLKTG